MVPGTDSFVAHDARLGRQYYIYRDDVDAPGPRRGWRFVCDEAGSDEPVRSTWEEWFFEILRYPSVYASGPLEWRRELDGGVVDLDVLQASFDGVRACSSDTPASLGLV